MIINQITQSDFTGNQVIRDSFSYQAAIKLYNFYEELSDDQGEPINFDPVAFLRLTAEIFNFRSALNSIS